MDGDISTRSSNACTAERENNCIELSVSPYGKGRTRNQSIDLKQTCNVQLLAAVLERDTIFLEFFVHQ